MEKKRNSNIELLRLVAMFFIVAGHFVSYSELIDMTSGINQVYCFFIGSGARIAVSLFLIIGIWFMIDMRGGIIKRVLKIYFEIWFYGVLISLLFLLFNLPVSYYSLLRSIFPFFLRSVWFGTAYISLLLISPFLNRVFEHGVFFLRKIVIILSLISIPFILMGGFNDTWLDVLFWFFYLYILIGYYKLFLHDAIVGRVNRYFVGSLGIVIYLILCFGKYYCYINLESGRLYYYGYKITQCWLIDYKQLPNLFCGFCFFFFFVTAKRREIKAINWIASGSFAVYVVHQVPPMESAFWTDILKCGEWGSRNDFIPVSLCTIILFIVIVCLLDRLRLPIERWFMNLPIINKVGAKMESFFPKSKNEK